MRRRFAFLRRLAGLRLAGPRLAGLRLAGLRSRRSIAAVEFAICAPMLLILVFGTIEIMLLYRTEERLNAFAGNYAEMLSNQEVATTNPNGTTTAHSPVPTQTNGSSPPGLSDLCAGAIDGLQPLPATGLSIDIASVTQISSSSYDEWETDISGNCTPNGNQAIGWKSALATATGNGGTTAMLRTAGDNVIIVQATLQYSALIGLIISQAVNLTQTAVARWAYASNNNISNVTNTPAPSSTLEFSCSGSGCETNYGV